VHVCWDESSNNLLPVKLIMISCLLISLKMFKRGALQVVRNLASKKVRSFLCAHHEDIKKNGGINPLILNFFTRWSSHLHVSAALSPIEAKGKFFPVYSVKACRGSRGTTPLSLNLSTRWRRWSTSYSHAFTPGVQILYLLNEKLRESQIRLYVLEKWNF
jgi:hypothetical protein